MFKDQSRGSGLKKGKKEEQKKQDCVYAGNLAYTQVLDCNHNNKVKNYHRILDDI